MKYEKARELIESAIAEAKIENQDAGKLFGSKGKYAPSKGKREPSYAERKAARNAAIGAIPAGDETKREIMKSFTTGKSQVHEPTAFERLGLRTSKTSGSGQDLARRIANIYGQISRLKENAETRNAEMNEAILKGDSARRSILLRKNKEARQQADDFKRTMSWAGSPQTAALYTKPSEPSPTVRLRTRKTDKHGTEIGGKKDFSAAQKAVEAGKQDADWIMKVFHRKPDGTKVKIFGTGPRGKEKTLHVHKKTELGKPKFYHSTSGKEVELSSGGVGIKVRDARTKKVMLDKGTDALWENVEIAEEKKPYFKKGSSQKLNREVKKKFASGKFSHQMSPAEYQQYFGRPKPMHEAAPDVGQNLKGMPRKSARKLAYALKKGGDRSKEMARQTRKMGSHAKRWGKKLDTALSDFSKRTGIPLKEGSLGMKKGIRMTSAVMNKGHTNIGKRAEAAELRAISKINKAAGGTGRISTIPPKHKFTDAEYAAIHGMYKKGIAGKNRSNIVRLARILGSTGIKLKDRA